MLKRYRHSNVYYSIIHKIWIQSKCPPTDEWIKRMWYTQTQWHIFQPREGRHPAIFYNTDGPWAHIVSVMSQRKTSVIWYHLHAESKKYKFVKRVKWWLLGWWWEWDTQHIYFVFMTLYSLSCALEIYITYIIILYHNRHTC